MHVFWLKLLRYMHFKFFVSKRRDRFSWNFEEFDLIFQDFKERERKKKKESSKFIIAEKNIWRI